MNKERLGAFIVENRKALDMTQKDLAERLHITDKAVSKWERGLSYPDVTLLEPLAAALGLGVEELMACRRQAVEEEEPMKALLDISRDNVKQERRRGWSRLIGVLALLAVTGLVVAWNAMYVTETRQDVILLRETVEGTDYLYMEEQGHLLKLKCAEGVEAALTENKDQIYRVDCHWNRLTRQGIATGCEATHMESLGGLMDAVIDEGEGPLFGFPMVYRSSRNYYPNPYGDGYLCDYSCWRVVDEETWESETLLTVEDCVSAAVWDWDDDGENELAVRTRWQEKPYTVYDMADGELVTTWLDTVPQEVRDKLVCIWEQ